MPNTPHETSTDLVVLHTLRCVGFAGLARVSDAAGLAEPDAESELIDLAVAGLVTRELGAWGLTDAGRAADAKRISDELDNAGARTAITEAYDRFMTLNPELLDLCTAWQTRTVEGIMAANDHTDPAYDSRVLDRLTDLDRRAGAVCVTLSAAMLRFQRYRARLTDALTRVKNGAIGYVSDDIASYHAVWFQLHEDLLATLGIPR